MKRTRLSFLIDFVLKERAFPGFITKLEQSLSRQLIFQRTKEMHPEFLRKEIYAIYDIPDYYIPEISSSPTDLRTVKVPLYAGYLINLRAFDGLEHYINTVVRKARYSQLRRYRKRLDVCLNPKYEIYYGEIGKETYDSLFNCLKAMIQRRFNQKQEANFELPYLDFYQEIMYPLIQKKKAALFVIYDRNKPINITLNFLYHKTVFHWNSCYDIDYSVFNLGHINMMNHLKWSYEQGFEVFDMGRGDFLHKRKWITDSYLYQEYIVYDRSHLTTSLLAISRAIVLKTRYHLINLLKKMKIHLVYGKYVRFKFNLIHGKENNDQKQKWEVENEPTNTPSLGDMVVLDIEAPENAFLIRPLNYFLHRSQESINDLSVYSDTSNDEAYYFIGKKKKQRIVRTIY